MAGLYCHFPFPAADAISIPPLKSISETNLALADHLGITAEALPTETRFSSWFSHHISRTTKLLLQEPPVVLTQRGDAATDLYLAVPIRIAW